MFVRRAICVGALLALACLGITEAASANNDPDVTYPTGTLLSVSPESPASILGTNVGELKVKTAAGEVRGWCTNSQLTGKLEVNNSPEAGAKATITSFSASGTGAAGECTGLFGTFTLTTNITKEVPWCLFSTGPMAPDEIQIQGSKCNSEPGPLTITIAGASLGTCKYRRTLPMTGAYQTDLAAGNDALVTFSNTAKAIFAFEEGSFGCLKETAIEFSYTLELDTTSSADPLYFS